jgi:hypothetical protein
MEKVMYKVLGRWIKLKGLYVENLVKCPRLAMKVIQPKIK